MLSKSTIKYIRALRHQKYRQKYHKIVVEGNKSVVDILREDLVQTDAIYATRTWIEHSGFVLSEKDTQVVTVEEHELAQLSALTTPQHVLAVCDMPNVPADPESSKTGLCLFLDGIRDPGNLGTIFRVADWFGMRDVFLSHDCVDPYNSKVIQASMSSVFRIRWSTMSLSDVIAILDIPVFAATLGGENVFTHPLAPHGILILGNESTGIRDLPDIPRVIRLAIPGDLRLGAESLNVAVAAGILCAEFRRR